MLSMLRTIFFLPSASSPFTFSRSALLSSPRTMRPSSATTDTPSTSRFVIFNATFVSSSNYRSTYWKRFRATGLRPHSLSVIVRAGHVISADQANQLAAPGLEPLRANRAIPGNVFVRRKREITGACCARLRVLSDGHSWCRETITRLRLDRSSPCFRGTFHGPTVIAHPLAREKRERRVGRFRGGGPAKGAAQDKGWINLEGWRGMK